MTPLFRAEMKHKLNPVLDAQLNRNRRLRGHRRNLSDPRFSTSLTDSYVDDLEVGKLLMHCSIQYTVLCAH